jgi:hypothetical protein
MQTTALQLTPDQQVVDRATRWCELNGTTISAVVTHFLARLPLGEEVKLADLPPITRRLYGCAAGGLDREDYRAHLLRKYGGAGNAPASEAGDSDGRAGQDA